MMKFSLSISLALGLAAFSHAADKSDHQLSEWKFGKVLFGKKITKEDMTGKVVVIEHWGAHCPRCIEVLPELVEMHELHRQNGLLFIAAESQQNTREQIEPVVKKHKIGYTITSGAAGPAHIPEIPYAFVFDVSGKLIYSGNPNESKFNRTIKKALEAVVKNEEENIAIAPNLFETRMWTNAEGNQMEAAVKHATKEEVIFLMPDGKEVTYPIEKLSEDSRKIITQALASPK